MMARGEVLHATGYDCPGDIPGNHCLKEISQAGFPAAIEAAKAADQVVIFVGTDVQIEKEGTDRQTLTLAGAQPALLAAVRKAVPSKPVTVVLLNGGAIAMDYEGLADAVVEAFFPGIEGSEAIACALYGERGCNKWGRLPVTVYPESFVKNDMADMGISTGGSGMRTYKYYTGEFGAPLFDFGFGLSLVSFGMKWASPPPAAPSKISTTANATFAVTVKNEGAREGDVVVMVYHCPAGKEGESLLQGADSTMPVPNRKLVDYKRVTLEAGASAELTFTVNAETLGLVDNNGDTQLFAGTHQLRVSQGSGAVLQRDFVVEQTAMLRQLKWD
jgi:beta-glucosidase